MNWMDPLVLFIVLCVILALIVLVAFRMKNVRSRYGLMQLVLMLIVLGLIGMVDLVSLFKLYKRWDLTENQRFTFSPLTANLLRGLQNDLKATVFVETTSQRIQFQNLLVNAHYYNPARVDYEFADPERDFITASRFPQPVEAPVMFLEYEGRIEKVTSPGEQELAQALTRLTHGEVRIVYLLQGHGQRTLSRSGEKAGQGYSYLRELLESQNRLIRTFEIDPQELRLPEDCDVLLIAGPEIDLSTPEYSVIDRYLIEGGNVIFLLDNRKAPGIAEWLKRYGFLLVDDMIIEIEQSLALTSEGLQPQITLNLAVGVNLRDHEMTRELKDRRIFAIESRSVRLTDPLPEGLKGSIFADSQSNSWAELNPNYSRLEESEFDETVDIEGPVPLGALVQGDFARALGVTSATPVREGQVIVFGDSDFAIDRYYGRNYGLNLLANMIHFLTQDTDLISIPPRIEADTPYILMTGAKWGRLFLASFVLMPGAVLMIGLAVYIARRRNG